MKIAGRLYYVITALAVFLAGIMVIIWSMTDTGKADYKDTVIDSDNTVSSIITCSSGNKVDFVALTKEDSRIYAYIDIVGTGIETPVIRSDDLTSGYAFTKSNNTKKFSERNTVIFLDSGTFADITQYLDNDYVDSHRIINVYTSDKDMSYRIFAVSSYSDTDISGNYDFTSFNGFSSYITDISAADNNYYLDADTEFDRNSVVITISVHIGNERVLILAVRESEQ